MNNWNRQNMDVMHWTILNLIQRNQSLTRTYWTAPIPLLLFRLFDFYLLIFMSDKIKSFTIKCHSVRKIFINMLKLINQLKKFICNQNKSTYKWKFDEDVLLASIFVLFIEVIINGWENYKGDSINQSYHSLINILHSFISTTFSSNIIMYKTFRNYINIRLRTPWKPYLSVLFYFH